MGEGTRQVGLLFMRLEHIFAAIDLGVSVRTAFSKLSNDQTE